MQSIIEDQWMTRDLQHFGQNPSRTPGWPSTMLESAVEGCCGEQGVDWPDCTPAQSGREPAAECIVSASQAGPRGAPPMRTASMCACMHSGAVFA